MEISVEAMEDTLGERAVGEAFLSLYPKDMAYFSELFSRHRENPEGFLSSGEAMVAPWGWHPLPVRDH